MKNIKIINNGKSILARHHLLFNLRILNDGFLSTRFIKTDTIKNIQKYIKFIKK